MAAWPWVKALFFLAFGAFLLLLGAVILRQARLGLQPGRLTLPGEGDSPAVLAIKGLLLDEGLTRQEIKLDPTPVGLSLHCLVDPAFPLDSFGEKIGLLAPELGYLLKEDRRTGKGETETATFSLAPSWAGPPRPPLEITLVKRHPYAETHGVRHPGKPRAAIVLDDLGLGRDMAERAIRLPAPVTLSIMPRQAVSEETAMMASRWGKEVLMHLPMEPLDYPEKDPGPGAIMAGMTGNEMASTLKDDLITVPGAVGINNHMGSRLTADEAAMTELMRWLAKSRLFFMDSRTSPNSVALSKARKLGLRTARRDIFLDNLDDPEYIRAQIDKLIKLSINQGEAVGIGHPRENTLKALEQNLGRILAAGVDIVPLSRLAR